MPHNLKEKDLVKITAELLELNEVMQSVIKDALVYNITFARGVSDAMGRIRPILGRLKSKSSGYAPELPKPSGLHLHSLLEYLNALLDTLDRSSVTVGELAEKLEDLTVYGSLSDIKQFAEKFPPPAPAPNVRAGAGTSGNSNNKSNKSSVYSESNWEPMNYPMWKMITEQQSIFNMNNEDQYKTEANYEKGYENYKKRLAKVAVEEKERHAVKSMAKEKGIPFLSENNFKKMHGEWFEALGKPLTNENYKTYLASVKAKATRKGRKQRRRIISRRRR